MSPQEKHAQSQWRRFRAGMLRVERKDRQAMAALEKAVPTRKEPVVTTPPELDRAASEFARRFRSHLGSLYGGPAEPPPKPTKILVDLHGTAFQKVPTHPLIEKNLRKEGHFPEK